MSVLSYWYTRVLNRPIEPPPYVAVDPVNVAEVSVAAFGGFPRRMQRVSEEYQAGHGKGRVSRRHMCRDSPAHGFTADEQRCTRACDVSTDVGDGRVVARVEHRSTVGHSTMLFRVRKVEGDDIETVRG